MQLRSSPVSIHSHGHPLPGAVSCTGDVHQFARVHAEQQVKGAETRSLAQHVFSACLLQQLIQEGTSGSLNLLQMIRVLEGLGVELADVLSAGRTHREPAVL